MKERDYITATASAHVETILDQLRHLAGSEPDVTDDEHQQVHSAVSVWSRRLRKRLGTAKRGEKIPKWPIRWTEAEEKAKGKEER